MIAMTGASAILQQPTRTSIGSSIHRHGQGHGYDNSKPRLRSACDSCRQSKVKCSGGSTCLRCGKQGVPCKYSLASRAGKPRGSRNKATLKKLEDLQERIQQKMMMRSNGIRNVDPNAAVAMDEATSALFWQSFNLKPSTAMISGYLGCGEEEGYYQSSCEGLVPNFNVEWSSPRGSQLQCQVDFQPQSTIQTPVVSSRGSTFSSPLSTVTDDFFLPDTIARSDLITSTELSQSSSPSMSLYACSPTPDNVASSFKLSPAELSSPPPPQSPCDCFESQAASLNQLYNLDRDIALWRFDASIQAVSSSLASCQKFLHCPLCRSECTNLLISISTLDLLFRVFRQLLSRDNMPIFSQDNNRNDPLFVMDDESCNIRCGQYSVPNEEGAVLRSFLIHRMLARSKETLAALREVIETCHADLDGQQQPWHDERKVLSSTGRGMQYNFGSPSYFDTGINQLSLTTSDVNFLRQVIRRSETILENLRRFTTLRYNPIYASSISNSNLNLSTGSAGSATSLLTWGAGVNTTLLA